MDMKKANIIRNVIRVLGFIFAAVAAILSFVFRKIDRIDDMDAISRLSTMCMISRICIILMFACAVVLLVFDLVTKQFPISSSGIGLAIALVGFIGNFIIAVASTASGFWTYIITHANISGEVTMTQLNIGSYMILASGAFWIAYNAKFMKSGT